MGHAAIRRRAATFPDSFFLDLLLHNPVSPDGRSSPCLLEYESNRFSRDFLIRRGSSGALTRGERFKRKTATLAYELRVKFSLEMNLNLLNKFIYMTILNAGK
jgi:hypothetical protein